MITLENNEIKVSIKEVGAELAGLYSKKSNLEYLWNADEKHWPRHSPVLFPIVGGLIDDKFTYKGKEYSLIKHGFARDTTFELEKSSDTEATYVLKSNEETLSQYPFPFELRHTYRVEGNGVSLTYEVRNTGEDKMFFSIGAHPAFNVPLAPDTRFEDYYLEFEKVENSDQWTLNGNILVEPVPYFKDQKTLALKPELFYNDAVIFKDLKSEYIDIKSDKTPHYLRYTFKGFPYMGIWNAKDAPFVCIEPWCGIPDHQNHDQNIENKEGIVAIAPGETFSRTWTMQCF